MKYLTFLFLGSILIFGCGPGVPVVNTPPAKNLVIQNGEDEEEYEVTIIDPYFQSWFATHAKPVSYYSEA